MSRHYCSSAAKCPYYKGEKSDARQGGAALFCQGVGGAETIKLFFRTNDKMRAQAKQYCRSNWQECPLAKTMNAIHQG